MNAEIILGLLRGTTPRGFLAALGALDVATRALPDEHPTLRWTTSLEPHAVLTGPEDVDQLIALCVEDAQRWGTSPVFSWGPAGVPLADLKPEPGTELPAWISATAAGSSVRDRAGIDLLAALVSEGAVAGKKDAKPTHLHFTSGNQKFLAMARALRGAADEPALRRALQGPWLYSSKESFRWSAEGAPAHAYRAIAPADDKTLPGVPGVEWLALLGLRYLPVVTRGSQLLTTGCSESWTTGEFTWPLWDVELTSAVARSLLGRGDLAALDAQGRQALGVHRLLRAPIHRSDQGAYGTFGAPELIPGSEVTRRRA